MLPTVWKTLEHSFSPKVDKFRRRLTDNEFQMESTWASIFASLRNLFIEQKAPNLCMPCVVSDQSIWWLDIWKLKIINGNYQAFYKFLFLTKKMVEDLFVIAYSMIKPIVNIV